uniref:Uncharacterized protein n=1 Tax=Anguilla anguilla TaxID=7936 RepID=A0A0E9UQS2_ANGAN
MYKVRNISSGIFGWTTTGGSSPTNVNVCD